MSLSISDNGLALIKKWEGCVLTAYQDAGGTWTIGYGHTSGVTEGMTITQTQADTYLKSDVKTAENAVNKYDSVYGWNQNQFDALTSFAYNVGNIKTLTSDGTRSISEISEKMLDYNTSGGKVLTGLTNRRKEEQELFNTPVSTTSSTTTSTTASNEVTASAKAKSKDSSLAGTYVVTPEEGLNVRDGAGTSKDILVTIPKGTKVQNYGYYTTVSGTKWLYIQFTYNSVKYTGFASSKNLESADRTTASTTTSSGVTEVTATDKAKSKDSSLAGTYKVTPTEGLNVRDGAGTSKKKLVTIPVNTKVKNYGYYTTTSGTKWLYIQFTYNCVKYTGFASSEYLEKV